jgi:hypothetical protein
MREGNDAKTAFYATTPTPYQCDPDGIAADVLIRPYVKKGSAA